MNIFGLNDNEVKLLGITIDNSLKFDICINNICTKANQKLSVLSRMGNILNFEQRRRIFKFKNIISGIQFYRKKDNKKFKRCL